jgi:hypothetical protein
MDIPPIDGYSTSAPPRKRYPASPREMASGSWQALNDGRNLGQKQPLRAAIRSQGRFHWNCIDSAIDAHNERGATSVDSNQHLPSILKSYKHPAETNGHQLSFEDILLATGEQYWLSCDCLWCSMVFDDFQSDFNGRPQISIGFLIIVTHVCEHAHGCKSPEAR